MSVNDRCQFDEKVFTTLHFAKSELLQRKREEQPVFDCWFSFRRGPCLQRNHTMRAHNLYLTKYKHCDSAEMLLLREQDGWKMPSSMQQDTGSAAEARGLGLKWSMGASASICPKIGLLALRNNYRHRIRGRQRYRHSTLPDSWWRWFTRHL